MLAQAAQIGIGPTVAIIGGIIGLLLHIVSVTRFVARIYFELRDTRQDYGEMKLDIKGIRTEMREMTIGLLRKIEKNEDRIGELGERTAEISARFASRTR